MWSTSNSLSGHSTVDALRILHTELRDQITHYEIRERHQSLREFLHRLFLHYSNVRTPIDWCCAVVVTVSVLFLILAFLAENVRDSGVLLAAIVLAALLTGNLLLLYADDQLRKQEPIRKAQRVLHKLQECMKEGLWGVDDYHDLNSPLSQCVSLQWTVRDSRVINLPCGLLVEGDIILLRPGQTVPVKCGRLRMEDDDFDVSHFGPEEFKAGDLYNPAASLFPEPPFCLQVEQRQQLKPQPFLVLETPIVDDFRLCLEKSLDRSHGVLDLERHNFYHVWIERRIMPAIFVVMLVCNALRYILLTEDVGEWPELFLVLQIQALIPLMALVFPVAWRILDIYGIAKVELAFDKFELESRTRKHLPSEDSFLSGLSDSASDDVVSDDGRDLAVNYLYVKFKDILLGHSPESLPRVSSIVQALGNMTSFCCVDKKGILSWPNPTVEKVFILTSTNQSNTNEPDGVNTGPKISPEQPQQQQKQQQQGQREQGDAKQVQKISKQKSEIKKSPSQQKLLNIDESNQNNQNNSNQTSLDQVRLEESKQQRNSSMSDTRPAVLRESSANEAENVDSPDVADQDTPHVFKSSEAVENAVEVDDGFTEPEIPSAKRGNFFEICWPFAGGLLIKLIQDQFGLHFDDPEWKQYINSLKPLGLNILLNTCNMSTTDKYTEFADHVTCASLKRIEAVPVVNKRCFCELSRQIGFTDGATKTFKTEQVLGMYRHIPPDSGASDLLKSRKSFLKYQTPMPNMFSVVVHDTFTGSRHLFSQGMADMLLDACSDFWDGKTVRTLTDDERRKIVDFYHRSSMSSYCTAFSYRPITGELRNDVSEFYLEVPDITVSGVTSMYSPFSKNSIWESQRKGSKGPGGRRPVIERGPEVLRPYHGSADSVICESLPDPDMDWGRYWVEVGGRGKLGRMISGGNDLAQKALMVQSEQIFVGMITMQYQAKQEVVNMIEALESSCIRFVHFSKENELRSRVFSEKMGLEAGWNCHISLKSDTGNPSTDLNLEPGADDVDTDVDESGKLLVKDRVSFVKLSKEPTAAYTRNSLSPPSVSRVPTPAGTLSGMRGGGQPLRRCRSYSAPTLYLTSLEYLGEPRESVVPEVALRYRMCRSESEHEESPSPERSSVPPTTSRERSQEEGRRRHVSSQASVGTASSWRRSLSVGSTNVLGGGEGGLMQKIQRKRNLSRQQSVERGVVVTERGSVGEVGGGVSATSSYSDMLDADGLGIANRAKLPKGVENIRDHIDNIDNVPLQVSLFTDCTPNATKEMLQILQDYGEVICCYGSAACINNGQLFLQADCSLSIEPQYPEICVRQSWCETTLASRDVGHVTPMKLCSLLYSLSCSHVLISDNSCETIVRLTALARHHCKRVRSVAILYISMELSICLVQLLACVFMLPPVLSLSCVLWLSLIVVPLISATLMGNTASLQVAKMALSKNTKQINKRVLHEQMLSFIMRYIPTLFVCLFCHCFNLFTFCSSSVDCPSTVNQTSVQSNLTNTVPSCHKCHVLFGNADNVTDGGPWNGWYTEHEHGLVISQQLNTLLLVLSFVIQSLCSVHWFKYLWQRSVFVNRLWCFSIALVLVLEVLYFVVAVFGGRYSVVYSLSEVPVVTWVVLGAWPLLLIPLLELIKHREIRMWIRHQKRARLDFGTKLGMNSPF